MTEIIRPNSDDISQQFTSLNKLRDQYDNSVRRQRDDAVIQYEIDTAPQAEVEIDAQNKGDKDSLLQNIAEIPKDAFKGLVKSVEEIGQSVGVFEQDQFGLEPPDDTFSSLVQNGFQFVGPFGPLFKGVTAGTKLLGLAKNSPKLKTAIDGMIAGMPVDAFAFDPQDGNAFNFLMSSLSVSEDSRAGAAIKQYLAVNPEDAEGLARAKNALTGVIGSVLFEKLIRMMGGTVRLGTRAIKNLKKADAQLFDTDVLHVDDIFGERKSPVDTVQIDEASPVPPEITDEVLKEATDETAANFINVLDNIPPDERAFLSNKLPNFQSAVIESTGKEASDFANFFETSTKEVQDNFIRIFQDAADGKTIGKADLESLSPFNLSKLNTPMERKAILAQMGEAMESRLPRNLGDPAVRRAALDVEIDKITKYFGVRPEDFIRHLRGVTTNVEGALAYIQSSKILTDIQVQRALKVGKDYLSNRTTEGLEKFTAELVNAVETAQGASGLGTAFGRGLAEFKNVADAKSLASQTSLVKAKVAHDIITSTPELGTRRAATLAKLDELAQFEKQADPDRFASNKPRKPLTDAEKANRNIKRLQKRIEDLKAGKTKAPKRQLTEFEESLKAEIKALEAEKQLDEVFSANNLQARARLKAARMSLAAKTRDALLEVYINGLLSSIKTSVVNFTGNATAIMSSIIERAYAGAVSKGTNGVTLGEAAQLTWSYVSALPDMWKTFWYASRHGVSDSAVKLDFVKPHDRALTKELWQVGGNTGKAIDLIGKAVNLPGQVLLSADEAFKMTNYRAQINALAYRKARQELGEAATTKEIGVRFGEIKNNVMDHQDILDQAKQYSELNTFTNHLPEIDHVDLETGNIHQVGGLSRTFKKLIDRDRTGLLRVFVPFFQTPVNLISFAGQRTPFIRKFSDQLMSELTSSNAAVKQLAEAKVATGNMIWTTAIGLAMTGNFTGPPPVDPTLRKNQEDAMGGAHWYSMMTDDGWVSYNRFDPLGIILGGAATMSIMAKSLINLTAQGKEDGFDQELYDKYQETFANATVGIIRLVTDRHYLQGFGNLVDFLTGDARGFSKGMRSLGTAINPAASFYSSFRRGVTRAIDPEKQSKLRQEDLEASDPLTAGFQFMNQALNKMFDDTLSSSTPGYGVKPAAVNMVGESKFFPGTGKSDELHIEPLEIMTNFFQTGINPFAFGKRSKSSVVNKLAELQSTLQGPETVMKLNGVTLSQEEHTFFKDIWTGLNKKLEKWVSSKRFNEMDEGMQLLQLENRIKLNKRIAEGQTTIKFKRLQDAQLVAGLDAIRRLSKEELPTTGLPLFNIGQQ